MPLNWGQKRRISSERRGSIWHSAPFNPELFRLGISRGFDDLTPGLVGEKHSARRKTNSRVAQGGELLKLVGNEIAPCGSFIELTRGFFCLLGLAPMHTSMNEAFQS